MSEEKGGIVYNLVCHPTNSKTGKVVFNFNGNYYEVLGLCDDTSIWIFKKKKIFLIAKVKFFSAEITSKNPFEFIKWL